MPFDLARFRKFFGFTEHLRGNDYPSINPKITPIVDVGMIVDVKTIQQSISNTPTKVLLSVPDSEVWKVLGVQITRISGTSVPSVLSVGSDAINSVMIGDTNSFDPETWYYTSLGDIFVTKEFGLYLKTISGTGDFRITLLVVRSVHV